MFTDQPSPFKPRSDSSWPVAALVIAVFAGFGLYAYVSRVAVHNESSKTASRPISRAAAAQPDRRAEKVSVRQTPTPVPVVPVPQFIAPRAETSNVNPNARATIYLCRAYAGGMFWSDTTCGERSATIDRMSRVPAALPFEQQVAIASSEAREASMLYQAPQAITAAAMESPAPVRARSAICTIYDQQVRDLDAEARHPLSASRQDQIRNDRMNVMSARARERC